MSPPPAGMTAGRHAGLRGPAHLIIEAVQLLLTLVLLVAPLACSPAPRKAALVVAVEAEPASLDPRLGSDVAADRAFRLLYRSLFRPGPDLRPSPDLVADWRQTDPLHYRFELRRGVRFSDGREVTASDAADTLNSILDGRVTSFRAGDLERIASVTADGRYGIEVTLKAPFAPLLSVLTVGILPAGTPAGTLPPVGCGPYRLKEWERGQWLCFEANPFADPKPVEPTVAFKVVPDPVVRALEMRRGGVDLVVNDLPWDTLDYFRSHGYPVTRGPGSSYAYIGLNCSRPPLDRPTVRRALAMAVDRSALIKYVLRGFGRPATGLLPPEHWASNGAVEAPPFDPKAAEALLDREGLTRGPGGIRFEITYKTSENKVSRQIAAAVAQDFARIGVRCQTQWLEWGTFYEDVKAGRFDAFALTWVGVTDPDGFRLRFASSAVPPAGFNRGRYANAEVDRLVEEGARESDPALRKALYGRVQTILARETPYISLWWPDAVCVARPGVSGVVLTPDGNFGFLAGVRVRAGG